MADEPGRDEIRELWRNQPVQPARMSAEDVRHKAEQFERTARRGFRVAVILLVLLAAGYGSLLYFFPSPMHRAGSLLALGGFLVGAHQLYRRGPARRILAGPASAACVAYREELERQRDFYRSAWSRLIAFVPGPVVFITGFVAQDQGPEKTALLAIALTLAPLAAGIPTNLRLARQLQREIDGLDNLMRQL